MSRTPWVKTSRDAITHEIAEVLRNTSKELDLAIQKMTEFEMPEAYIAWAPSHQTALNDIAGLISQLTRSMPDQTYCFERGVPCLIERTKAANAKKRGAAQPTKKTHATKRKGTKS